MSRITRFHLVAPTPLTVAPTIKGGIARDAGVADVCASGAKNLGFESYAFSCVFDATLLCL